MVEDFNKILNNTTKLTNNNFLCSLCDRLLVLKQFVDVLQKTVLTFPHLDEVIKDSLSTTMQRAPKRRFRGPRKPKVLRRYLKAVEICLHPGHPSVEWIEIFLWSYEIYQGTIGAVLI